MEAGQCSASGKTPRVIPVSEDVLFLGELPKGHVSYSQKSLFDFCPQAYEYRYEENIKIPPPANMINGTAAHKALEVDLKQKIESKENMDVESVKEVFSDSFDKSVQLAKEVAGGVQVEEEEVLGKVKDSGAASLQFYHEQAAQDIHPVEVEKEYTIEFKGLETTLVVKPDVLTEEKRILDFKTMKQNTVKNLTVSPEQFGFYQLANPDTEGFQLDALVRTKVPAIAQKQFPANTEEEQARILKGMDAVITDIRVSKGRGYFPRKPGYNFMNCKMCGFQEKCYGRKVFTPSKKKVVKK